MVVEYSSTATEQFLDAVVRAVAVEGTASVEAEVVPGIVAAVTGTETAAAVESDVVAAAEMDSSDAVAGAFDVAVDGAKPKRAQPAAVPLS